MTTVSKVSIGTIKAGYDVTFVEGDFPTYGMIVLSRETDEDILKDVLSDQNHNRYGKTGNEAEHLATMTNVRVIYEA